MVPPFSSASSYSGGVGVESQSEFNQIFHYDPPTGSLTWKINTGFKRMIGKAAGKKDAKGYLVVGCLKKDYRVHRIVWVMVNGVIPDGMQIDHINGVKSDNRISNLRLVCPQDNQKNMAIPRSNSSGVIGVGWDNKTSRWRAKIMVNRKTIHLGRFDTLEAASTARKKAEHRYGFHSNHGRTP